MEQINGASNLSRAPHWLALHPLFANSSTQSAFSLRDKLCWEGPMADRVKKPLPLPPPNRNTGPKINYKCFFSALEGSTAIFHFAGFQDYFSATSELKSTSFTLQFCIWYINSGNCQTLHRF